MAGTRKKLPLEGVRVTDFCWIGAGSYTTKLLADMGADVLKIESETHLDSLRLGPPFKDGKPGVNRSGYFADRNSSKRSVTLNMKHPRARETVLALIAESDVVANNFTPGVMEKFGLGYDDVAQVKPDIVYLSMSMQGRDGPEHGYLGYGLTIGALTGLQYLTGNPGREPAGTGTNYPDHIPNPCHAAFAVLAALRHRRRTGEGQYIDVAQTEPTIALLGPALMAASAGDDPAPRGNQHVDAAPHGVYPTRGEDRWIAIAATGQARWRGLLAVLGDNELGDNPDFALPSARARNAGALDAALAAITRRWDGEELMHALQARHVPAGIVQNAADVVDNDPQLAHRGHWQRIEQEEVGEMLYNAPPFRYADTEVRLRAPAPRLGEHTREVAVDLLGLGEAEIEALTREGLFR